MHPQNERLDIQRLGSLDIWPGPASFEPIPGGITNRNYRVESGGQIFVARVCVERERLGIDRRNEVVCQRAAHALGVAPEVVHAGAGFLISAHVNARTLSTPDLGSPGMAPRVAGLLRRLHAGWNRLTGEMLYFSGVQTVRTYARTARSLGASTPDDLDAWLADTDALAARLAPFVPTLCHNDMLAGNLLDDGRALWLVDWEYAGIGHPLFDLGNFAAHAQLDDRQELEFLASYREIGLASVSKRDVFELRAFRAVSHLREALWSVIQTVASDIDFDYVGYAADHFRAHRAARARLD
jgi:thiamine kinase-like enzyme